MSQSETLSQWEKTVSTHMSHMSRTQAYVLALWSYGIVLAKSCGITSVAALLAGLLDTSPGTMRQRLREWCYDKCDKKGEHRQAVDVTLSFAPLLSWIRSLVACIRVPSCPGYGCHNPFGPFHCLDH